MMKPAMSNVGAKPTRHFRLVCWRLLYHVDVLKTLDRDDEEAACRHARFSLSTWNIERARCQREWTKLLAKRQRRLAWFQTHGSIDDGWTPPDPADPRRTANRPVCAYLARRGLTIDEFNAKYARVPCWRVRKWPNWRMILRVSAWK